MGRCMLRTIPAKSPCSGPAPNGKCLESMIWTRRSMPRPAIVGGTLHIHTYAQRRLRVHLPLDKNKGDKKKLHTLPFFRTSALLLTAFSITAIAVAAETIAAAAGGRSQS